MKVLVVPANGIGDALLMMIASHAFAKAGHEVSTVHPALKELQGWFPGMRFADTIPDDLSPFDLVVVENDNSRKVQKIKEQKLRSLSIFYPTHLPQKHGEPSSLDQIFDPQKTMVDNIAKGAANLLALNTVEKSNGIVVPQGLHHRLYKQRVLLHPTSANAEKNWLAKRFIGLSLSLKEKGYEPIFCLSAKERPAWQELEKMGISVPHFKTLDDLARFTYESGYLIGNDSLLGHLASNLCIPTLTIANEVKRMRLWRPGWHEGKLITPPVALPNMKFLRLRKKYWAHFISKKKVLAAFNELVRSL
jgi:heptosyltransferase-3